MRFKLSLELPRNQRRQADESAQASDDVEALKLNRALVAALSWLLVPRNVGRRTYVALGFA